MADRSPIKKEMARLRGRVRLAIIYLDDGAIASSAKCLREAAAIAEDLDERKRQLIRQMSARVNEPPHGGIQ